MSRYSWRRVTNASFIVLWLTHTVLLLRLSLFFPFLCHMYLSSPTSSLYSLSSLSFILAVTIMSRILPPPFLLFFPLATHVLRFSLFTLNSPLSRCQNPSFPHLLSFCLRFFSDHRRMSSYSPQQAILPLPPFYSTWTSSLLYSLIYDSLIPIGLSFWVRVWRGLIICNLTACLSSLGASAFI